MECGAPVRQADVSVLSGFLHCLCAEFAHAGAGKNSGRKPTKKALNALRRPMCILVSLVLILAILTAVVMLVVPELVNAFGVLADQIPVFSEKFAGLASGQWGRLPRFARLAVCRANRLEQHWPNPAWLCNHRRGQPAGRHGACGNRHCRRRHQHHHRFHFALYILLGKKSSNTSLLCWGRHLPQRACNALAHVGKVAARTFAKFVSGQCIEACILGTLCWLGMLLFRFPMRPWWARWWASRRWCPLWAALVGTVVGAFMIGDGRPHFGRMVCGVPAGAAAN